jgi:hypothetical protein
MLPLYPLVIVTVRRPRGSPRRSVVVGGRVARWLLIFHIRCPITTICDDQRRSLFSFDRAMIAPSAIEPKVAAR